MVQGVALQHKDTWGFEIDGLEIAQFKTCSEIKWTAADVVQRSGGSRIPHSEPGSFTYEPITLARSLGWGRELYDLAQKTIDSKKGVGVPLAQLKFNCDLVDYNLDGTEARRVTVYNAYINSYSFGDRDNNADEYSDETIILKYDYYELVTD